MIGNEVKLGNKLVGQGHPTYIVAEIGINHNGNLEIAKKLIEVAKKAGCDAVKFQTRTPNLCVSKDQANIIRETPWGNLTYLEYRTMIEFGCESYYAIDKHCKELEIDWFVSVWDKKSLSFIRRNFNPICYKIPSAKLTDLALLEEVVKEDKPIILSTGMSTIEQIDAAVDRMKPNKLILLHCTSTYPCKPNELNLRAIETLRKRYGYFGPIGYSGHETGLQTTLAAVSLGANLIERHITLDRSMWGSDQASSLEPQGLNKLVRDIRIIEEALGNGIKKVYDSEKSAIKRLRI